MTQPSTTITEEGRRTRRILTWIAAVVVGLNLLVWVLGRFAAEGGVSGPAGSSFVTTPSGLAALEGSLARLGFETRQLRRPLDEAPLPADGTLVISDVAAADYPSAELNAIDRFMRSGGRLVVAGQAGFIERLFAEPPTWSTAGRSEAATSEPLRTDHTVPLSSFGSLDITGSDEPLLVSADGTVIAASRPVGDGRFVWVADSHPLHNQGLVSPDAAVAMVDMLDPVGPVIFDELRHGYTEGGGIWAVIPPRIRLALVLVGVAALVALLGYGRRFGPPYDTERRLPPGREAFLESVAGILSRSGDRGEALDLIRSEAKRRLSDRWGHENLPAAAAAAGLDADQIDAVFGTDDSDETLVKADSALATLTRQEG